MNPAKAEMPSSLLDATGRNAKKCVSGCEGQWGRYVCGSRGARRINDNGRKGGNEKNRPLVVGGYMRPDEKRCEGRKGHNGEDGRRGTLEKTQEYGRENKGTE